jgi:hypothetical protein
VSVAGSVHSSQNESLETTGLESTLQYVIHVYWLSSISLSQTLQYLQCEVLQYDSSAPALTDGHEAPLHDKLEYRNCLVRVCVYASAVHSALDGGHNASYHDV